TKRRLIIFVGVVSLRPGLSTVIFAPVGIFGGGIHRFRSAFAGEAARDRASGKTDSGANRPTNCGPDCGTCGTPARRSDARSYGMRAGRSGNWIAVCIFLAFVGDAVFIWSSIFHSLSLIRCLSMPPIYRA